MEDDWSCVFGKHFFRITHTEGYFLYQTIHFKCEKCGVGWFTDRLVMKMYIMGQTKKAVAINRGG